MSDPLTVELIGGGDMGNEQARDFALSIFAGVKRYIKEHRAEFEAWEKEQGVVSNGTTPDV